VDTEYVTYGYDGLGRQTTVTAADGSVTTTAYAGNAVTVYEGTSGATVWKRYVRNAMGNLTAVYEPNPAVAICGKARRAIVDPDRCRNRGQGKEQSGRPER
jgi:hypothetical protein